jgi:hypothetical protein
MFRDIDENALVECRSLEYAAEIEAHGGHETVADDLLRLVTPEILDLQSQQITTTILKDIQRQQDKDESWETPMGYLDFVTDSRDREWLRLYVGQCVEVLRRVVNGHAQSILKTSIDSLHYFMIWLGNGSRSANFIRLWKVEEHEDDDWKKIRMNLLEALFCQAFSTHHGVLDRIIPTPGTDQFTLYERPSYGLNLMTPLAQDGPLIDFTRSNYIIPALKTPDEQISLWVNCFRVRRAAAKRGLKHKLLTASRPRFRSDFDGCLRTAIGDDNLFKELKASIQCEKVNVNCSSVTAPVPFFGSTSAKVGFILDYAAVSPEEDSFLECPKDEDPTVQLPWPLKVCNFTESNILLWTYDFGKFLPLAGSVATPNANQDELRLRHQQLIDRSQVRIIFLCGPRAEKAIRIPCLRRFTLELRGFRYPMYLMDNPTRILLRCPAVPCEIWSKVGAENTQIGEGIRFAISLLGLQKEDLRPYSLETTGLVGTILCHARNERLGREKLTLKTVDTSVLLWLRRKGLAIQVLERIEKLAGSLSRGLLMILHSLPRNKTHPFIKRPMDPELRARQNAKRVRCYEPFDKDTFREVKQIVREAVIEKEESYTTALQSLPSLPPEKPPEGDQSPEMDSLHAIMHPGPAVTMEKVRQIVSNEVSGPSAPKSPSSLGSYPDQYPELEDSHILELEPLLKRAVDLGLLDLKLSKARRDRLKFKGHIWRQEVGIFRDKEYIYQMDPNQTKSRSINVNYCNIGFGKNEDVGDGTVWVKIEVNPPGQRHEKCYAADALDSDPASRLAFCVRYKDSRGERQERYAHAQGRKPLYAANTLVDILVDDRPNEIIAKTSRRYLYFTSESKFPEELKRFVGGGYTPDI